MSLNNIEQPISYSLFRRRYFENTEWINLDMLENKIIKVIDYKAMVSKYGGMYALVMAEFNDKIVSFNINGFMLKQLKQVNVEKFPLTVKVVRRDRFWRFSNAER